MKDIFLSTTIGAFAALVLWNMLALWPNVLFFSLCLMFTVYLLACPLYQAWKSSYNFSFWKDALVTVMILIGPAVHDPMLSDDIHSKMLIRISLLLLVSLYSILAIHILDTLYGVYKSNKKELGKA